MTSSEQKQKRKDKRKRKKNMEGWVNLTALEICMIAIQLERKKTKETLKRFVLSGKFSSELLLKRRERLG